MAGGGKDRSQEGLGQAVKRVSHVLQELIIPDSPGAIVVVIRIVSVTAAVVAVFVHAAVCLKTRRTGVGLETHAAIGRAVVKGGMVTLATETVGKRRDTVGGICRDDIGLYEHRDRR